MVCLWHPKLIPHMPDKTLKRLFRTCCELRQNWRTRTGTKQGPFFVRDGMYEQLIVYHQSVMREMASRGLEWEPVWDDLLYMGIEEPFRRLREDYLQMYLEMETPYGYMDEKYLCNQILWLRNHGKDVSKILNSLRQNGFSGLKNLF